MVYVTQLIYLVPGREKIFDEFEAVAIPIIARYHGRLLFRVRPDEKAFIQHMGDRPYEIHLVEFDSESDLEDFKRDEERKKFVHLKELSIRESVMILGNKL